MNHSSYHHVRNPLEVVCQFNVHARVNISAGGGLNLITVQLNGWKGRHTKPQHWSHNKLLGLSLLSSSELANEAFPVEEKLGQACKKSLKSFFSSENFNRRYEPFIINFHCLNKSFPDWFRSDLNICIYFEKHFFHCKKSRII